MAGPGSTCRLYVLEMTDQQADEVTLGLEQRVVQHGVVSPASNALDHFRKARAAAPIQHGTRQTPEQLAAMTQTTGIILPGKALEAVCFISAMLRLGYDTHAPTTLHDADGGMLAWSGAAGMVASVTWGPGSAVTVCLEPSTPAEWHASYAVVGWCQHHRVSCAPLP